MLAQLNPAGDVAARLSPATRALAKRYLAGGFASRVQPASFSVDDLGLPADASEATRHGKLALLIAARAPIFVMPEELLLGTATFAEARAHRVPGWGERSSVSHTTVDFADAVRRGLRGLEAELAARKEEALAAGDAEAAAFHAALLDVVVAMRLWARRHVEACEGLMRSDPANAALYAGLAAVLRQVPENPPATFREAVQSLWAFFEFQRLCGNWSGLGRLDLMLGGYLEDDLRHGRTTLDEAREVLAHFWIKGTEWCYGMRRGSLQPTGSGDAQFYQNVILGGLAPDGTTVDNAVTRLVLDVVEELHISDYPVAVRVSSRTAESLWRRVAEVQLLGGGIVSIYNEDVVMKGMRDYGYPAAEAAAFTNDGCWEVLVPGQTCFGYIPFDALEVFQGQLFPADGDDAALDGRYPDFEALFAAFASALGERCAALCRGQAVPVRDHGPAPDAVISLLMPSCRERGKSYYCGGAKYNVRALHAGGLPDVANSLRAIDQLVYRERRLTLSGLVAILRRDWQGAESLRHEIAATVPLYGNDDDAADAMMRRVFDAYADAVEALRQDGPLADGGILNPAGVSTFGREIEFAPRRLATAFGKHAHEFLATNLSPTPGTDAREATAVIRSFCKMDFTRTPNGCPLDLRLSADLRRHPDGARVMTALLKAFVAGGGFYLQPDVADAAMLRAAKADPDRFPNLAVRISGWSARFASLSPEWQDMIIQRTEHLA